MNNLLKPTIITATLADYPAIQNMAQFYVYDASRECGFSISENGLYDPNDYKSYFEEPTKKACLIKIADEISGFALLNQAGLDAKTNWKIDQFFVLAKFQGKGIGQQTVDQILDMHPGIWEVSVIPENKSALFFWRKVISSYTNGIYARETKVVTYDEHQPQRIIFTFDTSAKNASNTKENIVVRSAVISDVPEFVELSYKKRRSYEKFQPQFWRYAGLGAEISQAKWFEELLSRDDHIMLTAVHKEKITGFIVGRLMPAPEVYNPGGLTLIIDDFCVVAESDWLWVGRKLITEIKSSAKAKGASQILVVCGAHDEPKCRFIKSLGLSVASEWYVGEIACS